MTNEHCNAPRHASDIDRRRMLGIVAGAVAISGLPSVATTASASGLSETLNLESAAAIGRAANRSAALETGVEDTKAWVDRETSDPDLEAAAFRDRLSGRIRLDFARGRVVNVDGWVLSETEAILYAHIAMLLDSMANS